MISLRLVATLAAVVGSACAHSLEGASQEKIDCSLIMAVLSAKSPSGESAKGIGGSVIETQPLPVLVMATGEKDVSFWQGTSCSNHDFRIIRRGDVAEPQAVVMLFFTSKKLQAMEFEVTVGDVEPESKQATATEENSGSVYLSGRLQGVVRDSPNGWVITWPQ